MCQVCLLFYIITKNINIYISNCTKIITNYVYSFNIRWGMAAINVPVYDKSNLCYVVRSLKLMIISHRKIRGIKPGKRLIFQININYLYSMSI
jgi:hypothetical protein